MSSEQTANVSDGNLYDVMEYPSQVHIQTHPERLATVAALFGLQPAHPTKCRVLELGCGNASNLIPMAWALPGSSFTGLDLAAKAIQHGSELAHHLQLKNLTLKQADLLTVDQSWGEFDYIIAHGIYAWVPTQVREHVLEICRQCLAPQGVAFISYNALPGAYLSLMLREMMLLHAGGLEDPNERTNQALALLKIVANAGGQKDDSIQAWIRRELDRILENPPSQLFHDELAPNFNPVTFSEFMRRAAGHGLRFVGETDFPEMSDQPFSSEAREALHQLASNRLHREQFRDFLKIRRFRQTLLTHHDNKVRDEPDSDQISKLLVTLRVPLTASNDDLAASVNTPFSATSGVRVETTFPLGKAVLHHLIEALPKAVSTATLLAAALERLRGANIAMGPPAELGSQLNEFLLQLCERGIIRLHTWFPEILCTPTERPTASPIARWQIERGTRVTSLIHSTVEVQDIIGKSLISLLDGTRDRDALCAGVIAAIQKHGTQMSNAKVDAATRADIARQLEKNLQQLADMALLVA